MDKKGLILKIGGFIFLAMLGLALFGFLTIVKIAKELPNPEQFSSKKINQSTKIYDRTGKVLLYEVHGEEKRTVIPLEQIPDYAKKATLAIEDQNFYEHSAFDLRGTTRAVIVNILKGKFAQGGSTITQQLARNAFLSREKTITRKVKELILANWIEKTYTKDQILNLYLNQIPYGSNAYGIEAASQTYLSKSAKDLSLSEAAMLAAMIQAPTYYSPWGSHKDELEARRKYALEKMLDLGFIDKEEEMRAKESKPKIIAQNIGSIKTPHFVMMVRDYLSSKYGEGIVENGGFKVITTIDASLQGIAERAVGEGANRNAEAYDGRNAALVAQDPKTGQILALVGSKDYFGDSEPAGCDTNPKISCQFEGNFNVAAQGLRQPGSSFKPFAYIAALKQGYSPETVVFDLPTEFSTYKNECPLLNINFANENSRCFHPENFDHQFRGPVNLRNSLAQSINIPSVKILYLAGISNTIKTAEDFGITTLNDPYRYGLSLVLGGGEVKLIDMVGAYSVFAQDGIKHQQAFILEIKDSDGKILENFVDLKTQVIEAQYARQINDILSDKSARSPLFQNSLNLTTFPEHEVALKTGTTNNYKDAWTIGYTPYLAAGVWAGNNNNKPMQKQAGSILAAVPIWHAFMSEALLKFESENFPRPEPVPQEKPMLNGQIVVNSRVHDILFYVDKNDPLGQQPQNPEEDSQFLNWELPAEEWVKNHGLNNLPTYIPPARNASSGMNQTLTPTQL